MREPLSRRREVSAGTVRAERDVNCCRLFPGLDLKRYAGGRVDGESTGKSKPLILARRGPGAGGPQAGYPLVRVVSPSDGDPSRPGRRHAQSHLMSDVDEQSGLCEETMWACAAEVAQLQG